MISLSLVDYGIIIGVLAILIFRTVGDVRDVLAAKFLKDTMKAFVKRKFSPKLTVIMPLESVNVIKQTLVHMNQDNVSAIVVVNTSTHPKGAGGVRYFIRKNNLKHAKVVARKNPDTTKIASEHARSGLVTLLPDTARLHDTFYFDAIFPFSNSTVDAVRYVPNVRIDRTLRSGVEALVMAWRQYTYLNGFNRPSDINGSELTNGLVLRAKLLRRKSAKPLRVVQARKSVVSISAQQDNRATWSMLQRSSGLVDFGSLLAVATMATLVFNGTQNSALTIGISLLLGSVVTWWSLSLVQASLADRLSIVLLSPFFFVITLSFMIVRVASSAIHLGRTIYNGLLRVALPSAIRKL